MRSAAAMCAGAGGARPREAAAPARGNAGSACGGLAELSASLVACCTLAGCGAESPPAAAGGQAPSAAVVHEAGDLTDAVVRVALPNGSAFPIAAAVRTHADTPLVFHSGVVPAPKNPDAPFRSKAYWGDTREQTLSVLGQLERTLASMSLGLGDVIKMTVFLVGDAELGGRMDFDGFMAAYVQFFGTPEQPNLPARSAVQVAGLANEGMLVEIEVVLARTRAQPAAAAPGAAP